MRTTIHRAIFSCLAAAAVAAAAGPAWAQGTGNGLQGEYYNSYSTTNGAPTVAPSFTRAEYVWHNFGPIPPSALPVPPGEPPASTGAFPAPLDGDRNFIRWRGLLEPVTTENVTFILHSDDNAALWINGVQVIASAFGNNRTGAVNLTTGVKVPIMVEFLEVTGNAFVALEWRSTTGTALPRAIVPLTQLYSSPVAAPVITPNGGEWIPPAAPPLVTITCATPNSTIFYTNDGSDPGLDVPAAGAIPYAGPFLAPTQGRIRARAYAANMQSAEASSAVFSPRLDPASVAQPPNTAAGVYFQYYHNNVTWVTNLPNFDRLIPQQRGIATNFTLPANPAPRDRSDNFGLKYTGYIQVTTAGIHNFQLDSDEGTKLFIGPVLVVNNDGIHNTGQTQTGGISLALGYHPITVLHHDAINGENLTVTWAEPGVIPFAGIPNARLFTETQPVAPVITPTTPTFSGPQNIQITAPAGTIYYTLSDEIGPDPRSFTGSGASPLNFMLNRPATIRAVAIVGGFNPSTVTSTTVAIPAVTGPRILTATAGGPTNEVVVQFDRAMSIPTLSTTANFTLTNGATVTAATPLTKTGALKGSWAFEDLLDGSTNGNTITLSNGAALSNAGTLSPAGGQYVHLDGVDDHVRVPDSTSLRLGPTSGTAPATGSFTVSLWMNPTDNTVNRRLINKWDVDGAGAGNARGWLIDINANGTGPGTGRLRFMVRQDTGNILDYNPNFNVLTAGAWQHIAARVDRQSNTVTLFRNGVRIDVPTNFNQDRTNFSNTRPILVGRLEDNAGVASGNHFSGDIDEVRIYNVALSDTEIAALAAANSQFASAVRLTTGGTALSAGTLYTLTTAGLQDRTGTSLDVLGTSATFRYQATGNVTREAYLTDVYGTNIGNSSRVADLVRAGIYPNNPTTAVLQATPVAAVNFADNFGQRFRGYFIPTAPGFYRFAIASDDNGQLWLSGDDDPSNKVMVSHCQASTGANDYADADVMQSAPVFLNAGQKYYFEALYKEGGGGDNCAIAVKTLTDASDLSRVPLNATALPSGLGTIVPYVETLAYGQTPADRTVMEGEPVAFQVGVSGGGPRTFTWSKGATTVSTSYRFAIANTVSTDAGAYSVVVSDGTNALTTINFTLTVTPLTTPTFTGIAVVPAVAPLTPPPSGPGSGNQIVTLTGSNLISPWMSVSLGGTLVPNLVLNPGGTSLTAVTPAHAPGTVDVVLNYPTGQSITLPGAYTYHNGPLVTAVNSVAPNVDGANGPIAGGQPLVLTGSSFITGVTTVRFGATNFGAVTSIPNTNTLNVTAPAGVAGPVDLLITTPFGSTTVVGGYTYHDPPTLVSLSSNGGPQTARPLTVSGTNFALGAGLTRVTFTPGGAGTAVAVGSAVSLAVTTPATPTPGVITTVQVSVTTPGGSTGNLPYTYYPPTQLVSIVSAEDRLAGGKSVIITGAFFSTTLAENTVLIAGNAATVTAAPDNQHLTVTVPALGSSPTSPTSFPVTVQTPNGVAVGGLTFTYYPAPTVAAPSPSAGANGGGDPVVLSGTNFSTTIGATTVTFNGVAGVITQITPTSITVTTPPLTPPGGTFTTVPVVVSSTGFPAAATTFDYYPLPTLDPTTPILPVSGTSQGGTPVVINGQGFRPGQTEVRVDGVLIAATVTATTISFVSPTHDSGIVPVEIKAPGGIVTISYTYTGPRIISVNPSLGPTAGGQLVTITGSGFVNGTTSVTIGGVAMTGLTVSPSQITFNTPAHAATPSPVNVVVTVTGQPPPATLTGAYSWIDAATLSTITPVNRGPMAGGQPLTITGVNFGPGASVTFNGVGGVVTSIAPNGTSLTVTTPGHAPSATPVAVNVQVQVFGVNSTNSLPYTYVPPPTITSVVPNRGTMNGGQTVTIKGTFFEANNQTQVNFGGTTLTAAYVSATTATVVTPIHAIGPVSVNVSTFTPAQSTGTFATFTFVDPATAVDLSLTLSASTLTPGINTNVIFTLAVSNTPANAASGVVVRSLLPAGLTFVTSSPSVGGYNPGNGQWTIGSLAASASATLQITAAVTTTTSIDLSAEIFACNQSDIDSTPNNGAAEEDDIGLVSISAGLALLLPPGSIGTTSPGLYFSRQFAATGGVPSYSWSIAGTPDLPPLGFDPATGILSGFVAPLPVQTYTFTVTVTDAAGATAGQSYSLAVVASSAVAPVVDATPVPPGGMVGVPYQFNFTAHDGNGPYTWSSTGTLPPGLSLNSSTGLLAGTPTTTAGSPFSFTIRASNGSGLGSQGFVVAIALNPVKILTLTLPNGTQNVTYDQFVTAQGGIGPTFAWSVSAGALPAPLAVTGTSRTATVVGAPTTPGLYSFTLRVQDAGGAITTQDYSMTVNTPGTTFSPTSPTAPPPGTLGQPFSLTLTASGGTTPYAWTLLGGALPTGVTLNGATGTISGTPTAAGVFAVTIRGASASGQSGTQPLTIVIAPPPIITTAAPLPEALNAIAYFKQLQATGGAGTLRWTITSGTLPTGLTLNATSGAISGIPTASSGSFDVTVTDANGAADVMIFTIPFINGGAGPLAIVGSLPPAHPGIPYSVTLGATGGAGPYTFSLLGTAPGILVDPTTGLVYGVPGAGPIGLVQVQVADSFPVTPQTALSNQLLLIAPLDISMSAISGGTIGSAYAVTLTVNGAQGTVVWTLVSGALPPGLTLDPATGMISGTPASTGTSTFLIQAADGAGQNSQQQFSLTVSSPSVGGGGGGGGGGGCGLLGLEIALLYALRLRRRK